MKMVSKLVQHTCRSTLMKTIRFDIQGYLVGNGVTDETFDGNALVPFAHGMGLISDDLYQVLKLQVMLFML